MIVLDMDERIEPRYQSKRTSYMHFSQNEQGWLITYPNLGHVFYPSSQWQTSDGPIPQYVLADLYAWLEAHSGLSSFVTPTTGNMTLW
jgi:hypothetical protein